MSELVRVQMRDGVAVVTVENPPVNALGVGVPEGLAMAIDNAAADAAMKAGKTVDEAVSGLRLPEIYKSYNMANAKADVQRVYDERRR